LWTFVTRLVTSPKPSKIWANTSKSSSKGAIKMAASSA
jgi:hypothetical protein